MFDFSGTHWSQIGNLRVEDPLDEPRARQWQDAWAYLSRRFRPAMVNVARRRLEAIGGRVAPPSLAEDVVQDFLQKCLEKDWLQRAAPQFGRFRVFIFVLVRRFTDKYVRWMRASGRAPKGGWISLGNVLEDWDPAAPEDPHADEAMVDWLRWMLSSANERVRARSPTNARVNGEILRDPEVSNAELSQRLDRSDIAILRHRGGKMLWEELLHCVRDTVTTERDLSAECEHFLPMLDPFGSVTT